MGEIACEGRLVSSPELQSSVRGQRTRVGVILQAPSCLSAPALATGERFASAQKASTHNA